MLRDIRTYKIDYSILALVAAAYLTVVVKYQTTPLYVVIATALFGGIYFLWGIFHHLKVRSLYAKVVLEYLLVACLAVAIVATLLI